MQMPYNKWINTHFICQIPQLKLSCWGCCGRDWKSKKEVEKQIDKNTFEFKKIRVPSSLKLLIFRDRFSEEPFDVSKSGICTNLVKFDNKIYACPLHKDINKIVSKKEFLQISKKDLRCDRCDVNDECETSKWFEKLSFEERKNYLDWLGKQNFDHYTYSIGNVEGKLKEKYLNRKIS